MADPNEWGMVQEKLVKGDRLAFLQLGRLITGCLTQLRAYDFQEEWEDLRQEVAWAVIANVRDGRLRDSSAFVGYVRVITRNKFMDRLKKRIRVREHEVLAWDDETARNYAEQSPAPQEDESQELWEEVERLPSEERMLVAGIYGEGKTYQEMSETSGIPLGTLKRRLRSALGVLRGFLEEDENGE
jgi:RNA polymerase sigma-70 factor (ECF subfamily)